MRSKVIFGHPKWPPAAILWEKSKKSKLCTDLKWWEMWSKVIFGNPKCHFVKKKKVAYWSEMARNAFKSDFRSSKMAAGSHFAKKNKSCVLIWMGKKCDQKWFSVIQNGRWQPFCEKKYLRINLKWREMWSKVFFVHPKWPPAAILWKKIKKIKVVYWSEMARNAIESDFRSSKMAAGSHFVKNKKSCVLIWNGEKCDQKWFSVIQNGHRQPFCEKKSSIALKWREVRSNFIFSHPKWGGGASQWPACKPFGDIHSICPWANTPILV